MPRKDQTMTTSHAPGDRVRIQHDPKFDREYRAPDRAARPKLDGRVGVIRERSAGHGLCFRVVVPGEDLGAWFEPSELVAVGIGHDGFDVGAASAQTPACCLCGKTREEVPYLVANDAGRAVCDECIAQASAMLKAEQPRPALPSPQDALASLAAAVAERDALRARLEAASAAWASCRTWWSPASEAERAALDAVDAMLGAPGVTKIAGPWQDGRDGLRWRPRGDEPTRSAATVGSSGWTSFASPPAGGPEAGGEGESRADRALLAAGWTLEGAPAPVDDAQALRTACEAVTGTVGLPAPELASALLATVAAELEVGREERARASRAREQARARLHEGDPAAVKP